MSRLTRDGTAEPVSRDQILRHARRQGNVHFPCSADHEQDHPLLYVMTIHTYIHICSRMPERDGKDQGEDSPKQAGSCWFARPCWLATSGANLYPPGVWFADAMTFFSGVTFVFVLLRLRLYAFVEAADLLSIVLRYAGAPIATRVSSFFIFVYYLEMSLFPRILFFHCRRFPLAWKVRRTFFPSGWCFSTL